MIGVDPALAFIVSIAGVGAVSLAIVEVREAYQRRDDRMRERAARPYEVAPERVKDVYPEGSFLMRRFGGDTHVETLDEEKGTLRFFERTTVELCGDMTLEEFTLALLETRAYSKDYRNFSVRDEFGAMQQYRPEPLIDEKETIGMIWQRDLDDLTFRLEGMDRFYLPVKRAA